jgi:hypothetical protein
VFVKVKIFCRDELCDQEVVVVAFFCRIFIAFVATWVSNLLGHTDGLLRALVINRLISHGDKQTINEAEKLFDQHLKGDIKISADLRSAVYRSVLSKGNSQTLDVMLDVCSSKLHSFLFFFLL